MRNLGFGWDRVENVLWRIYHEELEGISPKKIWINIGTNNLHLNTDDEIVAGLALLVRAIRVRQPQAQIYLSGVYPRRAQEKRVAALNSKIKTMARTEEVKFSDIGVALLLPNRQLNEQLFYDGLHPNAEGYEVLGKALAKALEDN